MEHVWAHTEEPGNNLANSLCWAAALQDGCGIDDTLTCPIHPLMGTGKLKLLYLHAIPAADQPAYPVVTGSSATLDICEDGKVEKLHPTIVAAKFASCVDGDMECPVRFKSLKSVKTSLKTAMHPDQSGSGSSLKTGRCIRTSQAVV